MADNDGAHICELLASLFLVCFPGMIESGMVYKAIPPLYGIPTGKNKMQYFAQRINFIEFMQKEYYKKKKSILDSKGKKISPTEFSTILLENSDYIYDFEAIMNRMKLNPILLETILSSYVRKDKFETLRKRITSEFRFMENENVVKVDKDTIKVKGLIGDRTETVFLNPRFYEDCASLLPCVEKALLEDHMTFMIDGVRYGLYELVSEAMNYSNTISRFKGLGEMDDYQLRETTMCPETRNLIQYTVDSIDETMKIIRRYDSDKRLILSKIRDISRDDLIGL